MRALTALALVAAVFTGCGASDEDCTAACTRPYVLAKQTADHRASAWRAFPAPQSEQAAAVHASTLDALKKAEAAFVAECVPTCKKSAPVAQVECWKRAQNLSEWLKCGH